MSPAYEISPAQQAANEQNAKHSTGPRSREGRNKVRHNGLKHGLTGQVTVMPWEDHQTHDKFCQDLIGELAPAGMEESLLANTIAEDYWRLNRIKALEENIFALGYATIQLDIPAHPDVRHALLMAQTFLEGAKEFNLLSLYESRLTRAVHRNRAEFKALKTARIEAQRQQLEEEAALHAEANKTADAKKTDGIPCGPAPDGFAFSTSEPECHIDRARRSTHAKQQFHTPVAPVGVAQIGENPPQGGLRRAA